MSQDPFAELLLDQLACYLTPLDSRQWETMLRRMERDIRHDFLYKLIGGHSSVSTAPTANSLLYTMDRAAADARLRQLAPRRMESLLEFFSTRWWGMRTDDWQARARLGALTGRADVLKETLEHLPEPQFDALLGPGYDELPESCRRVLLYRAMSRTVRTFAPLPVEIMPPKLLPELALRCDYALVSEGPESVARLMASYEKAELPQRLWPTVFAEAEKAPALLEAALKEHRRLVGGRPFFFDLNGPIYALCLFRAHQMDKLKKLTFRDSQYQRSMEALKWPARIGEEGSRALVLQEMQQGIPPGIDGLFVALGMFWSFPDELAGRAEQLEQLRDQAAAAGLAWAATQLAQVLDRSQGRGGPHALVDWGRSQAPWQRALEELAGLKGTAAREAEGLARLAWEYADGKLEAREQKRMASGEWGGGKGLALKKLRESAPSYLIEQDHRVLKHVQPGGSRYTSLVLNERAWLDLVGHPHVVDAAGKPLTVERGESAVEVHRHEGDWVISVTPEFALNRKIALDDSESGRLVVYEKTAAIERLLAVVGSGLLIPPEGTEQLQQALGTVASQVEVRGWKGLGAQKIQADSQPRVLIRPSGPGLRAEVRVRPLGNEIAFPPGEGPPRVGNAQVETERDLSRERELGATLRPYLKDAEPTAEWSWRTHWLEDSLELLEALQGAPIEWPEGAALKLRTAKEQLELRVSTTDEDWFAVQGDLALDDGRSLSLSRLLELVANSRGRFVALGEGEYLALTEELRRQLDDLRAVTDGKKGRVHPMAAQALQDLPGDADWERHKARIASARAVEPKIPRTLQAELRSYQEDGVRWMLRLAALGAGACLADDMGLGKTVQTIAVLLSRAPGGPALVVAPTSVCPNWVDEAARFAPTLVLHQLPAKNRTKFLQGLGPHDVLVASYGVLEELGKRRWHTVVLDEAQAIKNAATQRSKSAQKLESDFRVITTGTPVENHLGELWNLFSFLNPGLLGTHQSFQSRFNNEDPAARHRLRRVVGPFLLRRTKSQVLKELPPRTDITLHVELPEEERALYEGLRQDALERLNEQSDPISVLAGLTRLRRACCHPELVAPGCGLAGAKLTAFLELVEELRDNRHRALVFSQFVDVLQIARTALDAAQVSYQYLDGSTPMAERKARVDAFQGGEGDLFLISLKAGGFGLNLTAADYVIHLDPWWNPAVEDQASDRAHRIGQERPVTVYRMVAQDTVEEKIVALHAHKRELAENLLEEGSQAAGLSTRELIRLLAD